MSRHARLANSRRLRRTLVTALLAFVLHPAIATAFSTRLVVAVYGASAPSGVEYAVKVCDARSKRVTFRVSLSGPGGGVSYHMSWRTKQRFRCEAIELKQDVSLGIGTEWNFTLSVQRGTQRRIFRGAIGPISATEANFSHPVAPH